jgi:hypothetical protein
MKMGDKAIEEVETISGSLGIDDLMQMDIQKEELLKYTVQNLLKKTLTLHAIAEAQKQVELQLY